MDKSVRFWNFISKIYSRQKIADPASYEIKLSLTRKHFNPNSKVLEAPGRDKNIHFIIAQK